MAPAKPMPHKSRVSWSPFLLIVSLSLISFSFYFLSFRDTIFWFVLSNAIIFLIAAADSDYTVVASATSPFKHKPDLYDEYVKIVRAKAAFSAPLPDSAAEGKKDSESQRGDTKGMESSGTEDRRDSNSEFFLSSPEDTEVTESPPPEDHGPMSTTISEERRDSVTESSCKEEEQQVTSETEKAIVAVDVSGSDSENGGARSDGGDFSALPVEELNRRVEDFIRRFNREIYLQELRERRRLQPVHKKIVY